METFRSQFSAGNTFHTYQAISCVQMGPSRTTLLKLAPPDFFRLWLGLAVEDLCTSPSALSLLMYGLLTALAMS